MSMTKGHGQWLATRRPVTAPFAQSRERHPPSAGTGAGESYEVRRAAKSINWCLTLIHAAPSPRAAGQGSRDISNGRVQPRPPGFRPADIRIGPLTGLAQFGLRLFRHRVRGDRRPLGRRAARLARPLLSERPGLDRRRQRRGAPCLADRLQEFARAQGAASGANRRLDDGRGGQPVADLEALLQVNELVVPADHAAVL